MPPVVMLSSDKATKVQMHNAKHLTACPNLELAPVALIAMLSGAEA